MEPNLANFREQFSASLPAFIRRNLVLAKQGHLLSGLLARSAALNGIDSVDDSNNNKRNIAATPLHNAQPWWLFYVRCSGAACA